MRGGGADSLVREAEFSMAKFFQQGQFPVDRIP